MTLFYKQAQFPTIPKIVLGKTRSELLQILTHIWKNINPTTREALISKHSLKSDEIETNILNSETGESFFKIFHKMLNSGNFDKMYGNENHLNKKINRREYRQEIEKHKKLAMKLRESKSGLKFDYKIVDLDCLGGKSDAVSDSTYDSNYEDSDPESCDLAELDQDLKIHNLIHKHKVAVQNSIPSKTSMILSKVGLFGKSLFNILIFWFVKRGMIIEFRLFVLNVFNCFCRKECSFI